MKFSLIRLGKPMVEFEVTKGDLPIHAIVYGIIDGSPQMVYDDCVSFLRARTNLLPLKLKLES